MGITDKVCVLVLGYNLDTDKQRIIMAEQNPTPTKNFTQMSADELKALINQEGENFVTQTQDGDIDINNYFASERFTLQRLLNLFFAFEYFSRAENSSSESYDARYGLLYELVYHEIGKTLDADLYGPEYIIGL